MTKEEAINTWLPIIKMGVEKMPECKEALDIAIKALEREPCEDAISRQAVHEAIVRWAGSMSVLIALPTRETIPLLDSIHKLPSVNPQEIRTGHWITEDMFDGCVAYRCSECDELFWLESGTPKDNEYNYCPKCGYKMSEIQTGSEREK